MYIVKDASMTSKDFESCVPFSLPTAPVDIRGIPYRGQDTDQLYAHFRPLMFPPYLQFTDVEENSVHIHHISTFIHFNLALACHYTGKFHCCESLLKRANELYCFVLVSQDCGSTLYQTDIDMQVQLVQCLALNNMAQLHFEMFEYECSSWCLNVMLDIHERTGCLCRESDDMITEWEAEEIKLNVFYAKRPTTAGSA